MVGLSVIYLPLLLLAGAALEPSQIVEQLLVVVGAPLLAALTLAALGGYRALAVASGLTVLACAVDVIAGSPLTSLSLLGPNPGLGVRFYGIGNELEALLGVLIVAGTGAGLAGFAPRLSPRGCAVAFLAVGLPLAGISSPPGDSAPTSGRRSSFRSGRRWPLRRSPRAVGVRRCSSWPCRSWPWRCLALVDLVSGANAHLTRSVLDAGGFSDLAQVAQRRLQLSAHSFTRPIVFVFIPLIAVLAAIAVLRRDRLRAWLRGRPAMRAGLIGAVAATAVGTLANDSGALLLEIGAAYLLVFVGYAYEREARTGLLSRPARSTTLNASCE